VVYRETRSWRWPVVQLFYMSGLAYVCAFIVYNVFK
jgi:ferrous iron transport protein B